MKSEQIITNCNNKEINWIEISQFDQEIRKEHNTILIDTRSYDEYNGWDLDNNGVEGHIQNAINIPVLAVNENNLKFFIDRNKINLSNNIFLYGKQCEQLAKMMMKKGYRINILKGGAKAWKQIGNKLQLLSKKEMIVPVSWVKNFIDENRDNQQSYRIIHVGWDETGEIHKKGHIPGSYWVHLGRLQEKPLWNKVNDQRIKTEMEKIGVDISTIVLVYGIDQTPSARFGIIAIYLGVNDVRLINGGLNAWIEAGYPLENDYKQPIAIKDFGSQKPINPQVIIDYKEALNYLHDQNCDLISIRSQKQQKGQTSGYEYIKLGGKIQGAKWGMGGSSPWALEDYRALDQKHMRPYNQLINMWKQLGINTKHKIAFYCGTGWRASEVWFYAVAMGVNDVSIYDGGWNEWSLMKAIKSEKFKKEV